MKIHRFITQNYKKEGNIVFILDENIIHQIKQVLKIIPGEQIKLIDSEALTETLLLIKQIDKKEIRADIISTEKIEKEFGGTLACAILKGDHFDLVVEKSTELGMQKIIPLITDRVIKKSINKERLQKIATEASEQSGRISVPEITEPQKLKDFLEENKGKKIYFAHISEKEQTNIEKEGVVCVGPEGGFTDGEISLFEEYNTIPLSLGKNVLRAETAAIVASFKMQ